MTAAAASTTAARASSGHRARNTGFVPAEPGCGCADAPAAVTRHPTRAGSVRRRPASGRGIRSADVEHLLQQLLVPSPFFLGVLLGLFGFLGLVVVVDLIVDHDGDPAPKEPMAPAPATRRRAPYRRTRRTRRRAAPPRNETRPDISRPVVRAPGQQPRGEHPGLAGGLAGLLVEVGRGAQEQGAAVRAAERQAYTGVPVEISSVIVAALAHPHRRSPIASAIQSAPSASRQTPSPATLQAGRAPARRRRSVGSGPNCAQARRLASVAVVGQVEGGDPVAERLGDQQHAVRR